MSLPLIVVGIIGGIVCVVGIALRVLAGTGTRWGDLGERLVPGGAAIGLPAIFEYLPLLLGVREQVFEQTPGWVFGVLWICSVTGAIFVGLNIRAYARPRHESQ